MKAKLLKPEFGHSRSKAESLPTWLRGRLETPGQQHMKKLVGMSSRWPHMKKYPTWKLFVSSKRTIYFWSHLDPTYDAAHRDLIRSSKFFAWWIRPEIEDVLADASRRPWMRQCSTRKLFVSSRCTNFLLGSSGSDIPCEAQNLHKIQVTFYLTDPTWSQSWARRRIKMALDGKVIDTRVVRLFEMHKFSFWSISIRVQSNLQSQDKKQDRSVVVSGFYPT
jgi:hypothetical protein